MDLSTKQINLQGYTKQYSAWLEPISEILNLAKTNNFKLYKSPSELGKLDCVQSLETQITPEQFFGLRQANWFIFEKNTEEE